MAWLSVGRVTATRDWVNVGTIQSNILRLQYTFLGQVPSRVIYGALRERYELLLYNSRWYNLYPKSGDSEVLVLDPTPGFEGTIYEARTIQVKQRAAGTDWQVQIDQWV
ncbi:MAG: hypothetical protein AAGD09_10105 [Cyanobacteria bacterium P01_F01_bin.56]